MGIYTASERPVEPKSGRSSSDSTRAFYAVFIHLFYLLAVSRRPAGYDRSHGVASHLAVFHYLPLHLSEMGRAFGGRSGDCPVTEDVSDRLITPSSVERHIRGRAGAGSRSAEEF